jgi:lipopolysaccharide biosynthesis glycosyltransferase
MQDSIKQTVRIFIGSSARNRVEEKVFVYSLLKHTSTPLEINIIDGETGSVTMQNGDVKLLPAIISDRLQGATAFSLARYAIPQWCDYQGKAIYCDSDQLSLEDIANLWNYPCSDAEIAAVHVKAAESGKHYVNTFLRQLIDSEEDYYLTSVMLLDCEKLKSWNIEAIVQGLNQDQFSYPELMFLGQSFLKHVPTSITTLPKEWNHLDVMTSDSKIVHFTDLTSQPWLFDHNTLGAFWERFYLEAVTQAFLSQADIDQAYIKRGISKRIKNLPSMTGGIGQMTNYFWRTWAASAFLCRKVIKSQLAAVGLYGRQATAN